MYPLVPPPITDTGAWQVPRTLQRWLDVNPVTRLTRTQAFITEPIFTNNYYWLGYSDIVASFNFEGPNNFSLQTSEQLLQVMANYLLCIMWTDSNNNVYRYKIWQNVGEVLYFNCPLYTGQKIGKNFRFEIWSISQPTAVISSTYVIGTETGGIIGTEGGGILGQE